MKLFRTSDTLLVCAMIAAAAFTYMVKHDAEGQLAELRRVEANIRFERDTIDVLRADLSLLTQPVRLQKLVQTFADDLQLQAVDPTQIGTLDELPRRPLDIETVLQDADDMAALPPLADGTTTGSVRP